MSTSQFLSQQDFHAYALGMFSGLIREHRIRRVLRALARQRVTVVLQPHNVWVIEHAFERTDDVEAALGTCLMRGWVEPLVENVPTGRLGENGEISPLQPLNRLQTQYRLTDGGWAAINRTHSWTVVGVLVGVTSLLVAYLQTVGCNT